MTRLREQLLEFHGTFGHMIRMSPKVPPDAVVRLRARLVIEEAFELLEAAFESEGLGWLKQEALDECSCAKVNVDMVALADALGDIDYVVEGTRVSFGIDSGPIADEIHRSNMAKAGGGKDANGKTLKPAGWTPPDIEGELRKQGWCEPREDGGQ